MSPPASERAEPTGSHDCDFRQWQQIFAARLLEIGMLFPNLLEIAPGENNDPVAGSLLERCGRHHRNAIPRTELPELSGVIVQQIIQRTEAKFVDHGGGPDRRAVAAN